MLPGRSLLLFIHYFVCALQMVDDGCHHPIILKMQVVQLNKNDAIKSETGKEGTKIKQ